MSFRRALLLELVLFGAGCSVVAPGEDELGGEYGTANRWCAQNPGTLCSDFDDQLLPDNWDLVQEPPGELSIDTTTFTSSPASLLSSSPDGTPARLKTTVPATALRTRLSFHIQLTKPILTAGQGITIAEFLCTDGTVYTGPWLQFSDQGGLSFLLTGEPLQPGDDFRFDEWVHVVLDVTWGKTGHALVEIDGVPLYDADSSFECAHPTFVAQVGIAGTAQGSARYDNLLYELTDG